MTHYDVFNGDADGICALQQLRLQSPKESVLVTGLKREINLLERVKAKAGDEITVLDISLDKNRAALDEVLNAGTKVFYADHHFSGELLEHENLSLHIDPTADTCTSLIINDFLKGAQPKWAVVGAFGDNFDAAAKKLGQSIGLKDSELTEYQQLGICLNYNGYGFDLDDLAYHPAELFKLIHQHQDPIEFVQNEPGYQQLRMQYQSDSDRSKTAKAQTQTDSAAVYLLPNKPWARRIVGVMGNDIAKANPDRAHALLIDMGGQHYRVSVRAPYATKVGADEFCRQFETGGGRKAAAGINRLPNSMLTEFEKRFNQFYASAK